MTIAFNLSQLANFVNTSGKLDASTGLVNAAPVANGGTGSTTLAANNVLLGNGTGALQVVAPSSSGNVLTSNGTTWSSTSPTSPGAAGQVFTGSGTFTVPAGVVKLKVQICGGGGGGASGVYGSAGTTTSFGSYLTATGGAGGSSGLAAGGTGTGGNINLTGGRGSDGSSSMACGGGVGQNNASYYAPGQGILGGSGGAPAGVTLGDGTAATGYGNGGCGNNGGVGGGAGGYCLGYITGLTPGSSITVTIGAAGAGGTGGFPGGAGTQGICIIEW